MATLSFGVDGPTMDFIVEMQIKDSDAPRILAYLASTSYGQVTENIQYEVVDPSWSPDPEKPDEVAPKIPMQRWETRTATPEETAKNFATAILSELLTKTVDYERQVAATQAAANVASINPL